MISVAIVFCDGPNNKDGIVAVTQGSALPKAKLLEKGAAKHNGWCSRFSLSGPGFKSWLRIIPMLRCDEISP